MPVRAPSSGVTSIATVGRAVGGTEGCYHTWTGTLYLRKRAVNCDAPMTLVESWGRSVRARRQPRSGSRRLTRRAALQLGAGCRRGGGRRAVRRAASAESPGAVDLTGDGPPFFAPVHDWPVPSIVTRAQWGANESTAQDRAKLRRVDREDRRAPHRHARTTSPTTRACVAASSRTRRRASTSTSRTTG